MNSNNIKYQENHLFSNKLLKDININEKGIFNDKKTKILKKEKYKYLVEIIGKSDEPEFIYLFHSFNEIKINILKIIINGFIDFNFEEDNFDEFIQKSISKLIDFNFNKNIFYFIYKKFSKIFRRPDKIKDINMIKRIDKLFIIWKILYSPSIKIKKNFNHDYNSYFLFLSDSTITKTNIEINIKNSSKAKNFIITLNFIRSKLLNLNAFNEKFSFLKFHDNKNKRMELKLPDLHLEDNNSGINSFSQIYKIKFIFSSKSYKIDINDNKKVIEVKKVNFDFNIINKIEILNYFIGMISSIVFEKEYPSTFLKQKARILKIEFQKNNVNNKIRINTTDSSEETNENDEFEKINEKSYFYYGINFSVKMNFDDFYFNNDSKQIKKNLNYIEYYGGFNSFIPLFKIVNYVINQLKEILGKDFNDDSQKNYLDKSIEWIKDIIKVILKLICMNEKNFYNFKKVIIPLLGSFAEISHSLNNLSTSNEKLKNISFFNDDSFSSLFVIILIYSIPNNIKKMYKDIFGINDNLDNLIISMNSIIFDLEKEEINNLDWYFILLIMSIEFFMIYFNCKEKVPNKLLDQLEKIIIFKNNSKEKDDRMKVLSMKMLLEPIRKIYNNKSIEESMMQSTDLFGENEFILKSGIYLVISFINIKIICKINEHDLKNNKFYAIFLNSILAIFTDKAAKIIKMDQNYIKIIKNINFIQEDIGFLRNLFPYTKINEIFSENDILIDELIDYHGQYHHLMKELFVFNGLWSNQKLYYNYTLIERKKSNIKYKNINYYTRNFQRPIIYPVLDYKNRYPEFSKFKMHNKFYMNEESQDYYNFDLNCPELDKLIEEYDQKALKEIEKNGKIKIFNVCLVKQLYHVKGKLFVICQENKLIIYFYSFQDEIQNDEKYCCNKKREKDDIKDNKKDNKKILCYGSLFKSQKKESKKKIKIELNEIRMILRRIYFYMKTAIEIFTETKSYYFTFQSEKKVRDMISILISPCENSYFPLNVNDDKIGYIKFNKKYIEGNFTNLINKKNNFIEYFSNKTSMGELCEMSNFDLIIILNLISNRSYSDLFQYPVFPNLFFYEKKNEIIQRDLKVHVGLQESTEMQKERKEAFLSSYEESDNDNFAFVEIDEKVHYFNTHYSNIVYTSNFMIRLFPYSFSSIEIQGIGFDNPNRLFFSIEDSLKNMSSLKSDIRELVPEFFYMPEMFMNINSINFGKLDKGDLVNDVIMPDNISNENNENNLENKSNCEKMFIYIYEMKNQLESSEKDIVSWINLIFGTQQKFDLSNRLYFREESYLDQNGIENEKCLSNEIIMNSCDFGLIPLQTIFDNKILENLRERKKIYVTYDYYDIINSEIEKSKENINKELKNKIRNRDKQKDQNSQEYIKKYTMSDYYLNEDYWDQELNIDFKINNNYNIGKLELYRNNILINEIINHSDIIIDFFYNRRLNMFATSSQDGLLCVYILPNKLFCIIKNQNNSYFDKVFLSSNPFPTILAFEEHNNTFSSYSLSGLLIKQKVIERTIKEGMVITPLFNIFGGNIKDMIKISLKRKKFETIQIIDLPFLEQESEEIIRIN